MVRDQLGPGKFAIFDTFANEAAATLIDCEIAKALTHEQRIICGSSAGPKVGSLQHTLKG